MAPLDLAFGLALGITLLATSVASGLSHRPVSVLAAARDRGRFARILVLDAIVVPLVVFAFVKAFGVPEDYAAGLILVGSASAGAIGLAAVRIARGDVPLAIGLIVVLEAANVVTIPIWSSLLLDGPLAPPIRDVLVTLVIGVLVPLGVGMLLRGRQPERATGWARSLTRLSAVTFAVVVAIAVGRDLDTVLGAARSVTAVALATVAATLACGWGLGYPGRASRTTASLVTSVRANTPALAVASASYGATSAAAAAIVVFALVSLLVAGVAAAVLARGAPVES